MLSNGRTAIDGGASVSASSTALPAVGASEVVPVPVASAVDESERLDSASQPPTTRAVIPTSASSPDGQRLAAGWARIASISPVFAASVR